MSRTIEILDELEREGKLVVVSDKTMSEITQKFNDKMRKVRREYLIKNANSIRAASNYIVL